MSVQLWAFCIGLVRTRANECSKGSLEYLIQFVHKMTDLTGQSCFYLHVLSQQQHHGQQKTPWCREDGCWQLQTGQAYLLAIRLIVKRQGLSLRRTIQICETQINNMKIGHQAFVQPE